MKKTIIQYAGATDALHYACRQLERAGLQLLDHPAPEVTHLLLPAPAFDSNGNIKGGSRPEELLSMLPPRITVIGGNLSHPALTGYPTIDLLQDPFYLSENAAITAHCAVMLAAQNLPVTLHRCRIAVIGWGRIGKCLSRLLAVQGACVTVVARKPEDRAMAAALGYDTIAPNLLHRRLADFRLIFNTAPAPVLFAEQVALCRKDCVKIDLASVKGIAGDDVIWARGLPNIHTPESSGRLIAETVIRILQEKESPL